MSQRDLILIGAVGAAAFLFLQNEAQEKEEIAALEAQNAALRAAASSKKKKKKTDWVSIVVGVIPVVGGIVSAAIS